MRRPMEEAGTPISADGTPREDRVPALGKPTRKRPRWSFEGRYAALRCQLCGGWIPLSAAVNGKPNGMCRGCGFQVFFRQRRGIEILEALVRLGDEEMVMTEPEGGDNS